MVALAAAGALASTGTAYVGARNLLIGQAAQARSVIPKSWDGPPRADGVYTPGGGPVERWQRGVHSDLHLMLFGDSTATGYGCRSADEVPGVLIARGFAEQSGKRIRLSTKAIVGATSKGLSGQVDAMFVAGPPPDAAVIMVGANDVTALNGIGASARRLGSAVRRLCASGAVVVAATCPDFGVITAIPQPLRWTVRTRGLQLARAQSAAVKAAGGVPVPLASLLSAEFRHAPELMLSEDQYHPSAAGYALAASQLLPALCHALGDWAGTPAPALPSVAATDSASGRPALVLVSRLWRRATTGVPAPLVVPTGG
jgi:lysophospholipase L1-like esterase